MVSGGKKIQDVSVDEFLFILKDLQVKFLEPEIRRIVKEEFVQVAELAMAAFPLNIEGEPDVQGHRSFHETLIARNQTRIDFWRKMTFELTKWGLLGFLGWMVYQLWMAFLRGPVK